MLESTNALIGALVAVLAESKRLEAALASGTLSESDEDRISDRLEQMHLAYADLSEAYEQRLPDHPKLLSLDALKARIASESI